MSRNKSITYQLISLAVLFSIWQLLSMRFASILIPSPYETFQALMKLFASGVLVEQFSTSLVRMVIGFSIGCIIATICGLLAGRFAAIYEMFRPVVSFLLGIPPIILVVLAMVWFGTNSVIPIMVVAILVFPTFFLNIANGYRQIDQDLLEMAMIYKKPKKAIYKKIIFPSLMIPFFSACSLAAGGAVRITVMAELLGSGDGMGAAISLARININTDQVFAWTFISILTIILLDVLLINPSKKRILKYQEEIESSRSSL